MDPSTDLPPDRDEMGIDVDEVLVGQEVPGCSVAVFDGGEVVLDRGFGTRRVGSGNPVTPTTRMPACSMSKPVSVLAALRLVERGLLDLDADISDHLTRWTLPANGDWRPRVTLRQLASHTAGLTQHNGFPGYRRGSAVPSLVEVLSGAHPANAPGARVDMLPGLQFRYSGAGTTLLQLLMEEVTGTSTAELLAELVLDPLDMRASTFVQDRDDERAHGHLAGGKPVPGGWRVQPEQCAAGLWTTPADYLRFLGGVQQAHSGVPDALVSPSTARELLTPVATLPPGQDMLGMSHIGLGFFVAARDGATAWFGHTGSNVGFVCASMASVDGRRGAVVMVNSDQGASVVRLLLQTLTRSRGWDDANLDAGAHRERPTGLGARAGTWVTETGLGLELAEHAGEVELTVTGQSPITLRFDDATTLSTEDLDLKLLLKEDGSISVEQGGRRSPLRRPTRPLDQP